MIGKVLGPGQLYAIACISSGEATFSYMSPSLFKKVHVKAREMWISPCELIYENLIKWLFWLANILAVF